MSYSQHNRMLAVTTPLGAQTLLLEKFTGTERVSGLFEFHLRMLAPIGTSVPFDKLVGQPATVRLELAGTALPGARFFNGIINRFVRGMDVPGPDGTATFTRYEADLVPALWKLTRRENSRLFLDKSVKDILLDLFTGLNVDNKLASGADDYPARPLCVQYRETDFAFVSRLMEEEGIFYWFKHEVDGEEKGKHTLVLCDRKDNYGDLSPARPVYLEVPTSHSHPHNRVLSWGVSQEWAPGKASLWDYQFQLAGNSIRAEEPILDKVKVGSGEIKLKVSGNDTDLQLNDYPGGYAKLVDGIGMDGNDQSSKLQKLFQYKDRYARLRIEQQAAASLWCGGESTARQFTPGCKFTLAGFTVSDVYGTYALTEVEHTASVEGSYTRAEPVAPTYTNTFRCLPIELPYRPPVRTPRPKVGGYLPAVVVGTSNQDVFTEPTGRVQVQFYWDRQGRSDLKNAKGEAIGTLAYWNGVSGSRTSNSLWLRVATPWADRKFGNTFTPRLGQEVMVGFLDGDPDQPAVLGAAYNSVNNPPWLSATAGSSYPLTSGQKTHIAGQDLSKFHGIAFDDRSDVMMLMMQTAKDMIINIPNNLLINVGKNCYINANGSYKQTQGVPITLPGFGQGSFPEITIPPKDDSITPYNWTIGDITSSIGKKFAIVFGEDTKAVVGLSGSITVGNKMDLLCDPFSFLGMIGGAGITHLMHGMSNLAGRNEYILGGKNECVLLPKFSTTLSGKYDVGLGTTYAGVGGLAPDKAVVGKAATAIKTFCHIVNLLVTAELLWYGAAPNRSSESFGIFVTVMVGIVLTLLWAVSDFGVKVADGIDHGFIAIKDKVVGLVSRITWEIFFVGLGIAFLLGLIAIAITVGVLGAKK